MKKKEDMYAEKRSNIREKIDEKQEKIKLNKHIQQEQ